MSTFVYNPPMEPYLDILYEDEHIIVMNKPSGLLSVPGKALEHADSIAWRVRQRCPEAGSVHRLDMSTSGVILVFWGNSFRNVKPGSFTTPGCGDK
jgi:tRNA pseudouridine32 synthase/23S rRNA pseudouridine746 synthase